MIVCVCNAITERDIDEAVAGGAHNLESLQQALPIANQCGSCKCCAEACVEASVDRQVRTRQPAIAAVCPLAIAPAS